MVIFLKVNVKVSHSLAALRAVGVRAHDVRLQYMKGGAQSLSFDHLLKGAHSLLREQSFSVDSV